MSRYGLSLTACLLMGGLSAGCGVHRTPTAGVQFVPRSPVDVSQARAGGSSTSLETYIEKVRALATKAARPAGAPSSTRAEARFPALGAALALVAVSPSSEHHLLVADEYRNVGILDQAYEHYARASRLDPLSAGAYEGLARIWRDWGFPNLGLADASRAVYHAPRSAAAHNTLGTILQNLGQGALARTQFETAAALEPTGGYARNNLCYSWLLEGQARAAIAACERAIELSPELETPHNNLGLAYAVDGNLTAALAEFDKAGDEAAAEYNLGIVYMARRRFADATRAFSRAASLRPSLRLARDRAAQASRLALLDPVGDSR